MPGSSLPDAAGVGRARLPRSWRGSRWHAAPFADGGAPGQTETDAPGRNGRGAGDKVQHSLILECLQSYLESFETKYRFPLHGWLDRVLGCCKQDCATAYERLRIFSPSQAFTMNFSMRRTQKKIHICGQYRSSNL